MQIQDKRVVVTGAASGIGKALCEAFKNAQAQSIVCVDMNLEGATETANEVGGIAVQANVGKESDIVNVIEKANEHSGGIDIFCSNAGIGGVHGFLKLKQLIGKIFGKLMFSRIYLLQSMFYPKC